MATTVHTPVSSRTRGAGMNAEREILATIAESTDAFIQVADLDYRWLAINRASADEFERIFGVRPSVGMSMLDILADKPEHRAAVKAVWSRALAGEEFTEIGEFGEVERRFYEMKYNSLRDPEGRLLGAFQIVTDATERVQAQRELEQAEAALRQSQKMQAIGQLTGGLAHDFNNLLQIVTGNLEMLQRRLPAGDIRLRSLADNAMRGAARAVALTQRLLAFSRPAPAELRVVEVNSVIAGMGDLVRQAVGSNVEVWLDLLEEPAAIRADPNALESAILNLVVNARDAMPDGGRLIISTSVGVERDLLPRAAGEPADFISIVICVADTGKGMDKATAAKIFEPFFTTKEPGRGTGLGLAMVYSFVQRAGGRIRVESEPDKGTIVRLGFPRIPPEEVAEDSEAGHSEPLARSREMLLVVGDNDDVRQHSVEALRELGYRVVEAHDGPAALSLLAKHDRDVDLMLCDIGLANGASGRELASEARRKYPLLRVLFTSGSAEADLTDELAGPGERLIAKPFTLAELALRVREMLDVEPPSRILVAELE